MSPAAAVPEHVSAGTLPHWGQELLAQKEGKEAITDVACQYYMDVDRQGAVQVRLEKTRLEQVVYALF